MQAEIKTLLLFTVILTIAHVFGDRQDQTRIDCRLRFFQK